MIIISTTTREKDTGDKNAGESVTKTCISNACSSSLPGFEVDLQISLRCTADCVALLLECVTASGRRGGHNVCNCPLDCLLNPIDRLGAFASRDRA